MEERMTYEQICWLVYHGMQDKIPSGYNIKYLGNEPKEIFNVEIQKEDINILDEFIEKPDKVLLSVKCEVEVPYHDDFYEEDGVTEYLEFGDVYLTTKTVVKKLSFLYRDGRNDVPKMREYLRKVFTLREPFQKKDVVFNITLTIDGRKFALCDLYPEGMTEQADNGNTEIVFNYENCWM